MRAIPGGTPGGTRTLSPVSGAFEAAVVDEPPELVSRPAVRYPPLLLRAGIEGHVTLRFVVDSLGIPEPTSLEVLEVTHAGFTRAAEELILRSQFAPGRVGARAVRVLVEQTVVFDIQRG